MAEILFGELDLYAGATEDFPFTAELFESDGLTAAQLAVDDVVHCVLSARNKGEPFTEVLDLSSDSELAGGSRAVITDRGDANTGAPAVGYLRFGQADTAAIVAGWDDSVASQRYVADLFYIDASESDPASAKKLFLRGVIHLHRCGASG